MIMLCCDDLPCPRSHRVHISTAFMPHLPYTQNQLLSVPVIVLDPVVAAATRSVDISFNLPWFVCTHCAGFCKQRQICVISARTNSQTLLEKEVSKTVNFYLSSVTIIHVNSVYLPSIKTLHRIDIHYSQQGFFAASPSCKKNPHRYRPSMAHTSLSSSSSLQ